MDLPRVALLVETSLGYGRRFLRGVIRYARLQGAWGLYINPADLRQLLPRMEEWGGTGIIARLETPEVERAVLATGLPTIALDLTARQLRAGSPTATMHEVRPDSHAAGRLAAEHLLERGLRSFAFVGLSREFPWSFERGRGFAERVAAAGLPCAEFLQPPRAVDRRWGRDQAILAAWLASLPRPVGVLACDDDRARRVCEACRSVGLVVPDDAAVVGVDNDDLLCELADPPLTSVALDSERGGWEAAALLDRLMRGEKVTSQRIIVPAVGVVVRRSTDLMAVDDAIVCRALRFIADRAALPIGVADVVAAAACGRRSLELRFRATIGRSIVAEIQRARVERTRRLLTESDLSIERIATASGFSSSGYLIRVFKRDTGLTPGAYRERLRGSKGGG